MGTINYTEQARLNSFNRSLSTIKVAQGQLNHLNGAFVTPADIESRIHLCNVLLSEILGIRRHLAKDLGNRHPALSTDRVRPSRRH